MTPRPARLAAARTPRPPPTSWPAWQSCSTAPTSPRNRPRRPRRRRRLSRRSRRHRLCRHRAEQAGRCQRRRGRLHPLPPPRRLLPTRPRHWPTAAGRDRGGGAPRPPPPLLLAPAGPSRRWIAAQCQRAPRWRGSSCGGSPPQQREGVPQTRTRQPHPPACRRAGGGRAAARPEWVPCRRGRGGRGRGKPRKCIQHTRQHTEKCIATPPAEPPAKQHTSQHTRAPSKVVSQSVLNTQLHPRFRRAPPRRRPAAWGARVPHRRRAAPTGDTPPGPAHPLWAPAGSRRTPAPSPGRPGRTETGWQEGHRRGEGGSPLSSRAHQMLMMASSGHSRVGSDAGRR